MPEFSLSLNPGSKRLIVFTSTQLLVIAFDKPLLSYYVFIFHKYLSQNRLKLVRIIYRYARCLISSGKFQTILSYIIAQHRGLFLKIDKGQTSPAVIGPMIIDVI